MSTSPQTPPAAEARFIPPPASVVFGRQDFLSVLFRLVGMELYKLRRRVMSKVLSIIAVGAMVLVFLVILLVILANLRGSSAAGTPSTFDPLLPPTALYVAVQVIRNLGPILIIILVGTIVGGEYGVGTIRLLFTRGPTRTQFLLAKIGAAIFCIVSGVLVSLLIALLAGLLFNLFTGITPSFDFFNATWLGQASLYVLYAMLNLFIYAMMALFLATVGRATAAGVAGALAWSFLEPVVATILTVIGRATGGPGGDFLRAVPDYFISSSISALFQNLNHELFGFNDGTSSLSDVHALLVLAVYLALFIGLAWWINERRDVTN
jgi:ABC-type transport system involved in multi-copper enzyme maturation permease subunit